MNLCSYLLIVIFTVVQLQNCSSEEATDKKYDTPYKVKLDKVGNFIDNFGRVCIYHGINAVHKSYPWYNRSLLNVTKLKYFQDWGFNVVRLGVMWSGVMPRRSEFNASYLNIQENILNLLAKYGMFAYLDMHQDVISSRYGSYDGVPRWLIDTFPQAPKIIDYPWPLKNSTILKNWFEGYLTYAVSNAFQNLYSNKSNSLGYWGQFWTKVASTYGKRKNVMGYELINEPWAGNIFLNPMRLLPGYAGSRNLLPVYDYLTKLIRSIDQDTLIFYEPVTWGVYKSSKEFTGSGFSRVPGGPSEAGRSVLSYHYYCWLLTTPNTEKPYPHWEKIICDKLFLKQIFKATEEDVKMTGGGRFLTEFGLCKPDKSPVSINTVECQEVLKQADDNLQSWSYWDSEFFDKNGNIYWDRVKSFARTYPRAVAGRPLTYSFNITTGEFNFSYELHKQIKAPTEIFLPMKIHYQKGYNLVIKPTMKAQLSKTNQILSIYPLKNVKYGNNTVVTLTITQK